ncbi:HET domain-containing protein [Podospora appendiculata]|uniref:HET domain-containing protein n=1 Tax=Podospora appendiculata TaxID=314037 RepID=A0AAE1C8K0_9PEZI|nr:HET domain-containing protein [Podospora appendiculata]
MRLLDTHTLQLKEFIGKNIPSYAILSHTWNGDEELSFQEWQKLSPAVENKSGYLKILGACQIAAGNCHQYLWIDTICIDKTSSAELSEAINSMFAWYRDSAVCYVYLSDVDEVPGVDGDDVMARDSPFRRSRWFDRGWTLQELLAPKHRVFTTSDWISISDFVPSAAIIDAISDITGIGSTYLNEGWSAIKTASVARRMSWASKRETTRVEDLAYCLFGLFNINMPLLYGEGHKAFDRLQEAIIRSSNDHTIFCWGWHNDHVPYGWRSVMAPSAKVFRDSAKYSPVDVDYRMSLAYTITNAGLKIKLPTIATASGQLVMLDVYIGNPDESMLADGGSDKVCLPLSGGAILTRASFPPHPFPLDKILLTPPRKLFLGLGNDDDWPHRQIAAIAPHRFSGPGYDVGFYVVVVGGRLISLQDMHTPEALDPPRTTDDLILFRKPTGLSVGFAVHKAVARIYSGFREMSIVLTVTRRGRDFKWAVEVETDCSANAFIARESDILPSKNVRPVYILFPNSGGLGGREMLTLAQLGI